MPIVTTSLAVRPFNPILPNGFFPAPPHLVAAVDRTGGVGLVERAAAMAAAAVGLFLYQQDPFAHTPMPPSPLSLILAAPVRFDVHQGRRSAARPD